MKRLKLIGSWKRIGVQAGLLAGLGLAFIGNSEQPATAAPDDCPKEGECTFKKPNFLIIADYSASMNNAFGQGLTRWEAAEAAIINLTTTDNAFFDKNLNLALMRFGHDPSASMGTTIMGDVSNPPLVDGQAIDVLWYDPMAADKSFFECNGQALVDALNNDVPPPVNGMMTGIGTWTKGALDRAKAIIAASKADHPMDMGQRFYANMVMTDGSWTSQSGTQVLGPPADDPGPVAADLFNNQQIPTYVVYFGAANDNMAKGAADGIAMAGGTTAAIPAENPDQLNMALKQVVTDIKNQVVIPQCSPGLPRFMILLDASSSMLNVNGGMMAGGMGATGWDQARDALAGANSIFDIPVTIGMAQATAEDVIHLGLAVFGHNAPAPGEQKIVVDYGPCHKDNFAWALDPNTSCGAGCNDPWGGPPITWTFLDGSMVDPPGFMDKTLSHMPQCAGMNAFCSGSGTYTHLGLQLIKNNQVAYHTAAQMPNAPFPADGNTVYSNILITDGQYSGYSTDTQVQTELQAMYNAGIVTYVIGFGDGVDTPAAIAQLNKMADWGSGNMLDYYDANNQAALEAALKMIIEAQQFDPCCVFNNCSINGEPDDQNQCNPLDPLEDCSANGQMCVKDANDEWYICVDVPVGCGNGQLDAGEECDDGNLDNGDGCSAECLNEGCGNGTVDGSEECDDGNADNTDACLDTCLNATCGDGFVQDGVEECDDGNNDDGDGCSALCVNEGGTTTDTTGTTTDGTTTNTSESTTDATASGTGTGTGTSMGSTTNTTNTTNTTATSGNESDTDPDSDTTSGGVDDGEGCNCAVDEDAEGKARGLLGVAFGLGLAGFIRRRRRA